MEFAMQELSIKERISQLIEDEALLERLLAMEKERRGVPSDSLLFIGASELRPLPGCRL
jgi:hypothetical protein